MSGYTGAFQGTPFGKIVTGKGFKTSASRLTRGPKFRQHTGIGTGFKPKLLSAAQQYNRQAPGQGAGPGAHSYVDAQLQPLLKAIQDEIARRSQQGGAAIQGYTQAFADRLGALAPQTTANYSEAEQALAKLNSALADRLTGVGGQQADQLASTLASINAPRAQTDQVVGNATKTGTGAANAEYAMGSAGVEALLKQAASARDYANKLPGIGVMTGQQQLRALQAQLNNELSTRTGQLEAQVPGMLQQYQQDQLQRQQNAASLKLNRDQLAFNKNVAQQSGLYKDVAAQRQNALAQERIRHDQATERAAARRNDIAAQKAARADELKAQAAANKTAVQHNKAVSSRNSAVDQARKAAYGTARQLANQTNPVTGIKRPAPYATAYKTLWAEYGQKLLRYSTAAGRPAWRSTIDKMIKDALRTAGYKVP